jgi:hypothetical protein
VSVRIQVLTLSRRKHGFESRRARQKIKGLGQKHNQTSGLKAHFRCAANPWAMADLEGTRRTQVSTLAGQSCAHGSWRGASLAVAIVEGILIDQTEDVGSFVI